MKKAVILAAALLCMAAFAAADPVARLDSPDPITLGPDNNYNVTKTYDTGSSEGVSFSWTIKETGETDSGPEGVFSFDTDGSSSYNIRLTASNGTHADTDEHKQLVYDRPRVSIATPGSVTAGTEASFGSNVNNSFPSQNNDSLTYNWSVDGSVVGSDSPTLAYTFSSSGDYVLNLSVTDDDDIVGFSATTVSASSSNNNDGGDDGGSSGGGGAGFSLPSDDNETDNDSMKKEKPVKATVKPGLSRAKGLTNNTKLQAALEKVLDKANMSEQARQNLMDLSEAIATETEVVRNAEHANNRTTVKTNVTYKGNRSLETFAFHDTVPKTFANHSDRIEVDAAGAAVEVVNADPEYLFTYSDVSEGDTFDITYEATSTDAVSSQELTQIAESFGGEVYGAYTQATQGTDTQQDETGGATGPEDGLPDWLPYVVGALLLIGVGGVLYWQRDSISPYLSGVLDVLPSSRKSSLEDRLVAATEQMKEDMDTGDVSYDKEKLQSRINSAKQYLWKGDYDQAENMLNQIDNILR